MYSKIPTRYLYPVNAARHSPLFSFPSRYAATTINPRKYVRESNIGSKKSHPLPTIAAALLALQFVMRPTRVDAVNMKTCGTKLLEQQNAAWNVTNATVSPSALKISREQRMTNCGTGMGGISWKRFPRTFGTWCIPWISLMFQIPFGAERESGSQCYTTVYD